MDEEIRKKYFSFTIDKPKVKKQSKKSKNIPQVVKDIKNFIQKEINYSYEKTISYSQISTYNSCPLKWYLHYKEGRYLSENNIYTVFGKAIHESIQHYLETMYNESIVAAEKIDLEKYFEDKFRDHYLEDYKSNNNIHFSNSQEMNEFFEDGIEILRAFKKKRIKYFSKKGEYLVGCELPLLITPNPNYKNVVYKGFLDIVTYNETLNRIKIIDIKTSTNSWSKEKKADENKQFQLLLYKKLFSEQYNFPIDNIDIEFFIVKRKLYETNDFVIPRISTFSPPSGKIKMKRADNNLNTFIETVFNKEGKYLDIPQTAKPDKYKCKYCIYSKHPNLCPIGSKFAE
jgi:hypothetical protein